MNLIERAKNMILTPASEWQVVAQETTSTAALYKSYIVPLAAIGAIATFIGMSLVGLPFFGTVPITVGLSTALVTYIFGLIGVYILALIINALAPSFNGEKNQLQALKVAAFSYTPAWVAGVLHILPSLSLLIVLASLYSLYVLYLGLPILMKSPPEKALGYTAVVVICAIVLAIIFGAIVSSVGFGMSGAGMWGRHAALTNAGDNGAALERFRQMGASMAAANKQMEAARQSGNPQAQVDAAGAAMGAMTGGNSQVEPVDQNQLKGMLPDSVGALKRNRLEAEKVGMGTLKISKATAAYSDNQNRTVDITLTDAGGSAMFGALAAWSMIEQEKETDNGYDKMGKVDGRPTHEKFDKNGMSGEYDVVVGGRFLLEARGHQVDMDTLKLAVANVGIGKLEAMKNIGVK